MERVKMESYPAIPAITSQLRPSDSPVANRHEILTSRSWAPMKWPVLSPFWATISIHLLFVPCSLENRTCIFLMCFLYFKKKKKAFLYWVERCRCCLISVESEIWFNGLGTNEVLNVFLIVIVSVLELSRVPAGLGRAHPPCCLGITEY